jgi:PAS domain S-box-containing protein
MTAVPQGESRTAGPPSQGESADAGPSRRDFLEIAETALEAIITLNARFEVVLFNRAAARMFGVPAAEALGGGIDRFIPPSLRTEHERHLRHFAESGGTSRPMGSARELVGLRANGEVFPMEASISRCGEGERLLLTVMARDVTRLRQVEREAQARVAAESANRAKTEFLSQVSHELRTPLNAVLGFAQLMRLDVNEPLGKRQLERIELVHQAGKQLLSLIDDMLDVSRIETGRLALDIHDVDLGSLLSGTLRMIEAEASKFKIRLERRNVDRVATSLPTDPGRLRQVLLNLLSNGIKYNRPEGWVALEVGRTDGVVEIKVIDGGIGMTEEQRSGLFEPFNRLGREHSGVEGMGIGLVLARRLTGLLGGELRIESQSGVGTTATLSLPLHPRS